MYLGKQIFFENQQQLKTITFNLIISDTFDAIQCRWKNFGRFPSAKYRKRKLRIFVLGSSNLNGNMDYTVWRWNYHSNRLPLKGFVQSEWFLWAACIASFHFSFNWHWPSRQGSYRIKQQNDYGECWITTRWMKAIIKVNKLLKPYTPSLYRRLYETSRPVVHKL